jgi:ABC-type glycerol-3-phosphate transport system substrate-binding protein
MPTLLLIIVYLSLTSLPVVVDAQTRQAALAAVMKLAPAERQARLVEGSKKESGLVWYSSTTAEDALALIKKFNEQHPSIQIQHLRSSSEKLLERILAEARANAFRPTSSPCPSWNCRS